MKRLFKRNSHNFFFKALAGFGRALNRHYENRNHDIYSNGELTVIQKLARSNTSLVIDGGANVGNYSLLFNKVNPTCKIYAFEPVASTFEILYENVKDHHTIIPINKGLFSENCEKEINILGSNEHSTLYPIKHLSAHHGEKSTIELISGDDFLKDNQITKVDFLKLDLEGAEYDALLGFKESLATKKIRAVQFEYGYINITTKKLLVDFYDLVEKYGYLVGKIFPKIVEFREYNYKYEDFIGPNFIAVDKDEKELINTLSR